MRRYRTPKLDLNEKAKLDEAFKELRKAGLIARQAFLCCSRCAGSQLAEDAHKLVEKGKEVVGVVFYHKQDADCLKWEGKTNLRYGQANYYGEGKEAQPIGRETKEVGEMVIKALAAAGVRYTWDGNPDKTIELDLTCPAV